MAKPVFAARRTKNENQIIFLRYGDCFVSRCDAGLWTAWKVGTCHLTRFGANLIHITGIWAPITLAFADHIAVSRLTQRGHGLWIV